MKTKQNKIKKSPKRITKKREEETGKAASIPTMESPVPSPENREAERDGIEMEILSGTEGADAVETPPGVSGEQNPVSSSNGEETGEIPDQDKPTEPIKTQEEVASFLEEDELELLTFSLAKEEYAIDILVIQEITKLTEITPIPRTPSYIHGIVTLRGNVIPVFDMHRRLQLDPFIESGKSRFVICQLKEGAVAITVDEVIDVVHLKKSRLEPPPSGIAANGGGFIKSIGRAKERLLILLDIEKALQIEESNLE